MPAILILVLLAFSSVDDAWGAEPGSTGGADGPAPAAPSKEAPIPIAADADGGETEASSESFPGFLFPASWTHVRPLSPNASELLTAATTGSRIVSDLLKQLDRTDVVVYLTDLTTWSRSSPRSHLVFLTAAAKTRYVLIRIDRWRLSEVDRIASLGHELQHAMEVAAAPAVRDNPGLIALYKHIGWESEDGRFESEAARTVGNRVRKELLTRR